MTRISVPGHDIVGVRAANPSPFTLSGTNSWLLGRAPVWLVDPGPDLADGIVEGKAGSADFRTPPLWGVSASGPPYLHDGRARNLSEAIGMHDGEARSTRLRWDRLSPEDRDALISFLGTL